MKMMNASAAVFVLSALTGCKSDVERCVGTNMTAYDEGASPYAGEGETRIAFKARIEVICAQAQAGKL